MTIRPDTCLPLTPRAVAWGWQLLGERAGVEWAGLNLDLIYGPPPAQTEQPTLCITPAAPESWLNLVQNMEGTLDWLPAAAVLPAAAALPIGDQLPILFWGDGATRGQFATLVSEQVCLVHADILGAAIFMASRWEETVSDSRDEHGRFPASASVAWRHRFLDRPVIDEYCLVLQAWLRRLLPGWQPQPRRFTVQLSHDIDGLRRFTPEKGLWRPGGGWRALVREALAGRPLAQLSDTVRDIGYSRRHDPADSHFQAIGRLVDLAQEYGFPAAFYFMTSEPGPRDDGYQLSSSQGQAALARVRGGGHELGLHPGYTTFLDRAELERQRQRFSAATGLTSYGGRQHYLRFRVPQSWRDWASAGFSYDSTLGYAMAPGFRAGTCLPFQPYDLVADEPINLIELPLIAMDVTFISPTYLSLTPAEAEVQILQLARRCQAVAGCFTLLWHNGTLEPPLDALYVSILGRLRQLMDDADE